jgi:hypothetical protein
MAGSNVPSASLFAGARRAQRYCEDGPGEQPPPEGEAVIVRQRQNIDYVTNTTSALRDGGSHLRNDVRFAVTAVTAVTAADAAAPAAPRTRVTLAPPPGPAPARWGWRGRLYRSTGGLVRLAPAAAELAHREAITTIRQATWPRAVNVIVTNPRRGAGRIPAALILAGILGHVRGGYVAAWETAASAGRLNRRAEGNPPRDLGELAAGAVEDRPVPTAADVLAMRAVLDAYYRITLTVTADNPHPRAYRAALRTADAAVLPCVVSTDALEGVEQALAAMRAAGGHVAAADGLLSRVVVVLGHDGGPEDTLVGRTLRARLDELGVAEVVEVPFDPAIRPGAEITLGSLSEPSTWAWTAAAAAVVRALKSASTDIDLVQQLQAATPASSSEEQ